MVAPVTKGMAAEFQRMPLGWLFLTAVESVSGALCLSRIAFGPITESPNKLLWLLGSSVALVAYLMVASWATITILNNSVRHGRRPGALLWATSLPFLVAFVTELLLLQFQPEIGGWVWDYLSTIEPFPTLAMAIVLVAVFLLKALVLLFSMPGGPERAKLLARCADVAVPATLLILGVLQASVYLIPIGNAFLRFWAIADALTLGVGYPVTLTEPGPMAAGSPPYVYDLPLFPMMLWGAFALLGHTSAAAHLPAALFNALFPLAAYLLIREATQSRTMGLVFGALVSLFPYLRFWVLNLPDPDPLLLTSLCLAAYFYLKALASPQRSARWLVAGVATGVLSLARPEGVLYAGFLSLGLLLSRPRIKQFALFLFCVNAFLIPMVVAWMVNFGFVWPQNYNRTLRIDYPMENLNILESMGALGFYHRGLGLGAEWALVLLLLLALSVLLGTLAMVAKDRRLLAIALPGIGNTVAIFFAHPHIPNTFHFADFFRHASFGIPFLVVTAAYGLHQLHKHLSSRTWLRWASYVGLFLLVMAVVREGDIVANPTATHHPGATQVLTTYSYLSMQDILEHPFLLPRTDYYRKDSVIVAHCASMRWPEDALSFYQPLDMSFDSRGRPFGYASVAAFLLGLCFALLAESRAVWNPKELPTEAGKTRGSEST